MKKLFSFLAFICMTGLLHAQTPDKISFQAVVRNSGNALVTNSGVGMRISILQGSASGTPVYVETQSPTTNKNGLVTIEIGDGSSSDDFSAISWGDGPYFIKTETDPNGGTDYSITGTTQFLSVPYALHAKSAERIQGGHYIGELYGGGIVFWVTPDGQHGLIASLDDMEGGTGIPWSSVTNSEIGFDAQNMTDGEANCDAIISQAGHTNSAAQICRNYRGGGFNDWYLPALRELKMLSNVDVTIDYILDNDGDANTNGLSQEYNSYARYSKYWSSTEGTFEYAWYFSFAFNQGESGEKGSNFKVRAIRAF